LTTLALAIPELWVGPPKFIIGHVMQPRHFKGRFVVLSRSGEACCKLL